MKIRTENYTIGIYKRKKILDNFIQYDVFKYNGNSMLAKLYPTFAYQLRFGNYILRLDIRHCAACLDSSEFVHTCYGKK